MGILSGNLELMVLLAVMRRGEDAYGVPIAKEIQEATGRSVTLAGIYAALHRLEGKGLVSSELGDSTAERGGRAKRYFRVTAKGERAVLDTQRSLVQLWQGLPGMKSEAIA
jgi:PadR family transcriptional regulator PadR